MSADQQIVNCRVYVPQRGRCHPDCGCAPFVCDACQREVAKVRGSIWHGDHRICEECFFQWYDPDNEEVDQTSAASIGNYVRKKHGLPPLPSTESASVPTKTEQPT